ncbi:hypothetical protein A7D27_06695 [Pseudomonas sp. 1D4]|nr:hypothetical protein A7D27_06695 [Pseudomonas sp. 1D4]
MLRPLTEKKPIILQVLILLLAQCSRQFQFQFIAMTQYQTISLANSFISPNSLAFDLLFYLVFSIFLPCPVNPTMELSWARYIGQSSGQLTKGCMLRRFSSFGIKHGASPIQLLNRCFTFNYPYITISRRR